MPLGRICARPSCIVRAARGLPGRPWPVRPATARRASARWSEHRSPGARRGAADGGAIAAEVEQTTALEHPRWRGYPPGMGVEAIAHRSSLSMGRGRKTGSAVAFSDEARAPVAGGGPATGRRKRELSSTFHRRKAARRGSGFAHRGRARDGGGGRTAIVARSDSVGRIRTRTTTRSGRARVRQGEATVWLGQRQRGRDGYRDADARS
jgi:hypothetical protein